MFHVWLLLNGCLPSPKPGEPTHNLLLLINNIQNGPISLFAVSGATATIFSGFLSVIGMYGTSVHCHQLCANLWHCAALNSCQSVCADGKTFCWLLPSSLSLSFFFALIKVQQWQYLRQAQPTAASLTSCLCLRWKESDWLCSTWDVLKKWNKQKNTKRFSRGCWWCVRN